MADDKKKPEWGSSEAIAALGDIALSYARELIDTLRAENDAMREIVQAVATYAWQAVPATDEYDVAVPCPWCARTMDEAGHPADCPVTKARALARQTE